jgi:hypothetical protein
MSCPDPATCRGFDGGSGVGDHHRQQQLQHQQQHPQQQQLLPRLTPQQAEARERRNRMTQRRRDLTYQIRKQKRNDYIGQKRNLNILVIERTTNNDNNMDGPVVSSLPAHTGTTITPPSATNASTTAVIEEFKTLIQSYCSTIETSTTNQPQDDAMAMLLPLQQLLNAFHSRNYQQLVEQRQQVIGATDRSLLILDSTDHNLARRLLSCLHKQVAINPQTFLRPILQVLVHLTSIVGRECSFSTSTMDDQYYGRVSETWTQLLFSTTSPSSWIATLVEVLLHHSTTPTESIDLVCHVLGNIVGDCSQHIPSTIKPTMIRGLVQAVPNTPKTAAWALTNMIRNDTTTYASAYCNDTLLSVSLLLQWLQQPEIATQTAWMIASLTSREEQVVQYLCHRQTATPTQTFPQSLLFVSSILQTIQRPVTEDQSLPLIQALGNIASYASLVPPLLTGTSPSILSIIEQLLTQTRRSRDPTIVHTTWLAGCLLVDVGIEDHPSTTMAAPTLVPILMSLLERTDFTLEEHREIVSALWNAFTWPPQDGREAEQPHHQQQQQSSSVRHSQHLSVKLSFQLIVNGSFLQSIVNLLKSQDGDAVLASVHTVEFLLRRDDESHFPSLVRLMQEEDIPDALERICDSPMEEASEIAADLLDDYFYGHDDDPNRKDSYEGGSSDQDFSWSITGEGSTSPLDSTNFGSPFSTDPSIGMARGGMGRGRGATLPSWMSK